jgi:hypothetical protein
VLRVDARRDVPRQEHVRAQATYKRSWKNLLLDARYQLRFTLFLVAICGLLMCMLGWWLDDAGNALGRRWPSVMSEAESATKVAEIGIKGNTLWDDAVKEQKIAALRASQARLELVLVLTVLLLCAGLFVYGIKMTHKVAGPLYKIGLYLDKVKAGKYDTVYNLRKGDQLMEFFDHFREAHSALRKVQERAPGAGGRLREGRAALARAGRRPRRREEVAGEQGGGPCLSASRPTRRTSTAATCVTTSSTRGCSSATCWSSSRSRR